MSFSCTKSVMGFGSQVLRRIVNAKSISVGCQTPRTLTRSMWHLSRRQEAAGITQIAEWTNRCQCCGLRTAGDKAISEFLQDEIKLEKTIAKKVPKLNGFELTKSSGSEVEFTKTEENGSIKVTFNINNSVTEAEGQEVEEESTQQEAVQMVSRPPFMVELIKGDVKFGVYLSYPEGSMPDELEEGEDDYAEKVILDSASILKSGEEWNDNVYMLQGHNMDGTLYDLILDSLDEHGITDNFLDELVKFATCYEQQKYIGFLENLQKFCGN